MTFALYAVLWSAYAVMAVILIANLAYLRGRRSLRAASRAELVSVVIPARDEARNLGRLLPSLLAQQGVRFEIVVYDDGSADGTAEIATGFGDARVRVLRGKGPPPPGWVGKVHALYQATRETRGDLYLFLDADTVLKDDRALQRLVERHAALPPVSVLTAIPHFRGGGRLIVSAVAHALLVSLPLPLVPALRSRILAALNGQMWIVHRDTYHEYEPHEHHRGEVLEDVRIGQYLSANGVTPYFADVQDELEVWMYGSHANAWRGFRKNAYMVFGGRPLRFLLIFGWFSLTFVFAPLISAWFLIPIYLTKLATDRFARYPLWVSLLAPVTFVAWAGLDLDSALSHITGRVRWKGRNVAGLQAPN